MEVKTPNKEIPLHPISVTQHTINNNNNNTNTNNPSSSPSTPPAPPPQQTPEEKTQTLDPSHKPKPDNSHSQSPGPSPSLSPRKEMVRYRECQRNHAAHLGSHVVDGCGEFMPSGENGTHLALKCAACNCHRNFHRRESDFETNTAATTNPAAAAILPLRPPSEPHKMSTTNCYISFHKNHLPVIRPNNNDTSFAAPTDAVPHGHGNGHGHRAPVMMAFGGAAAESSSDDLNAYGGQLREQYYGASKKRFRTKFSQEQKDKMMEFAEKLGWKIQKQDDVEVLQFCHDVGVKRQVFKVWMHNNKQSSKKKQG